MTKTRKAWLLLSTSIVLLSVSSSKLIQHRRHTQCGNSTTCPTWFTCDTEQEVSICHCGKTHDDAVVCDEKRLVSAVLDCHCVTYDEQTETTHLGTCFYNCENHNTTKKRDPIYRKLYRNFQNRYSITQSALASTELAYCVVTVKMVIVH